MLKIRTYIIVLLLVFLSSLVVTTPASFVLARATKSVPGIVIQDASGTIWSGAASLLYQSQVANIAWDLHLLKLLMLKLAADIELSASAGHTKGQVELGIGQVSIQGLQGKLNASGVNQVLVLAEMAGSIQTDIEINNINLIRSRERFELASGQIEWAGGLIQAKGLPGGKANLPPMLGELSVVESGLSLSIAERGKTESIVDASLSHGGEGHLQLRERVSEYVEIPEQLIVGQPDSVMFEVKQSIFSLPEPDPVSGTDEDGTADAVDEG